MTKNQIKIKYDQFFGTGMWERDYKPHITVFTEQCLRESENSTEWVDSNERLPNVGDRLLVKTTNGSTYYAVYTNEDEFDVNQCIDSHNHRGAWFKYTKRTVGQWQLLS